MAKSRILVVDDDEAVRKSLGGAITAAGFELITANDGKEGLVKALNEQPDLLVLDVEMPHVGGMEVLKEIRKADAWGKKVPVIILTNFDTSEEVLDGIVEDEPAYYLIKAKTSPASIIEKIKEKLPNSAGK